MYKSDREKFTIKEKFSIVVKKPLKLLVALLITLLKIADSILYLIIRPLSKFQSPRNKLLSDVVQKIEQKGASLTGKTLKTRLFKGYFKENNQYLPPQSQPNEDFKQEIVNAIKGLESYIKKQLIKTVILKISITLALTSGILTGIATIDWKLSFGPILLFIILVRASFIQSVPKAQNQGIKGIAILATDILPVIGEHIAKTHSPTTNFTPQSQETITDDVIDFINIRQRTKTGPFSGMSAYYITKASILYDEALQRSGLKIDTAQIIQTEIKKKNKWQRQFWERVIQ